MNDTCGFPATHPASAKSSAAEACPASGRFGGRCLISHQTRKGRVNGLRYSLRLGGAEEVLALMPSSQCCGNVVRLGFGVEPGVLELRGATALMPSPLSFGFPQPFSWVSRQGLEP
jgi:hypothetical protein